MIWKVAVVTDNMMYSSSVNTKLKGKFVTVASINRNLEYELHDARRTLVKFHIITENTFVIYFQKQLCVSRVQFIRQKLKIA